jgi:hypothetical protein
VPHQTSTEDKMRVLRAHLEKFPLV